MSSRQPTYLFFASPKKSRQKKGDPTVAVGLWPTALRCSRFGASRRTRFAAFGRCAQTAARSQLTKRAAHAAPNPCAPRRHPRGPKNNTVVCCANIPCPRLASHRARAKRRVIVRCAASRVWCSSAPSDELSSTGLCGARVSAHQQLTSGGCLNAVSAANEVSSARPAETEQRKAALAQRGPSRQGRFLCPLSLSTQRKGVGRRAETPARPHAVNKCSMRMQARRHRHETREIRYLSGSE
jgi:hypothetical protein